MVPSTKDKARSYFRSSNVDLFSSLIKERKFIDTVENLTIFVEEKNGNDLKKIYFKDNISINQSQIIFAKTGEIKNTNGKNTLLLYNGKFINTIDQKQNIFNFSETEIDLSKYSTKTTTHPKIQETKTVDLYDCLLSIIQFKKIFTIHGFQFEKKNCALDSFNNVKEELFKRIFLPIYFLWSQNGGVAFVTNSGSSAIFTTCTLTENSATDVSLPVCYILFSFFFFTNKQTSRNTETP